MIKAVIIEDSRLARLELIELLKAYPWIKVEDQAENIEQALEKIAKAKPQLLFLDINLPEGDAFDLLKQLDNSPYIIFTTAYSEFALSSFDYNTIDYLLKPIKPSRLAKALEKAKLIFDKGIDTNLNTEEANDEDESIIDETQKILVKEGDSMHLLTLGDVYLMESIGNHSRLFTESSQPMLLKSLSAIEKRLDSKQFLRANRQQIINMSHIKSVELWFGGKLKLQMKNDTEIEVSRRNAAELKKRFCL